MIKKVFCNVMDRYVEILVCAMCFFACWSFSGKYSPRHPDRHFISTSLFYDPLAGPVYGMVEGVLLNAEEEISYIEMKNTQSWEGWIPRPY